MSTPWSWQLGAPPSSYVASYAVGGRTWHRRLWGPEIAFAAGTVINPGTADLLLSCIVSLPAAVHLYPAHVRLATRALRWSHPAICISLCWPLSGGFKPESASFLYEVPANEKDVEKWLDEVVHERTDLLDKAEGDLSGAVALLRHDLGVASANHAQHMFQVHHIGRQSDNTHAFLVYLGHALFDGIGAFEVLDLWLHELGGVMDLEGRASTPKSLDWGQEVSRLAKSVPDRAKVSWTPDNINKDHFMAQKFSEAVALPPVQFGLPILNPTATPSHTETLLKVLPAPTADLLRKVARAHGCGVFSVLLAADFLSILRLNPPKSGYTGTLHAPLVPNSVNLRGKHLTGGPASDRTSWQVTSAIGATAIVATDLDRFLLSSNDDVIAHVWTLAKEIQLQVGEQQEYQDTAVQWVPFVLTMMMGSFFQNKAAPPERLVNISSMGVVDDNLAKSYPIGSTEMSFEISQPIFSGTGALLPPGDALAIVHPYTWQGDLYFSFSFPAAYIGTIEEQKMARKEGKITLLDFVDKWITLVQEISSSSVDETV